MKTQENLVTGKLSLKNQSPNALFISYMIFLSFPPLSKANQ